MPHTVVSLDQLAPPAIMAELEASYRVFNFQPLSDNPEQLTHEAADCRILVTTGAIGASAALMTALPELKLVAVYGVGLDAVDLEYCRKHKIAITYTPDVLTECVADLAIALLLSASRRIVEGDRFIRDGHWTTGRLGLGWSLRQRKLGILGYGRIGQEIARLARAFEMEIYYNTPHPKPELDGVYVESPVELARTADVLVVTCSGGPDTRGLVNRNLLRALGPEGLLVNISRGSVVDEQALIAALEAGELGAAALDVFADEPKVPEALLAQPQLVLTPHIASATDRARTAMGRLVLDNIAAFVCSRPLITPVPGVC